MHISDVLKNKIKHLINQRVRKYKTVNQNFVAFFVKIEPKATSNKAKPIILERPKGAFSITVKVI